MVYKVKDFERTTNAFNYVFEYSIPAGETILLKMPVVSANKRGINDIGWQCDSDDVRMAHFHINLKGLLCGRR